MTYQQGVGPSGIKSTDIRAKYREFHILEEIKNVLLHSKSNYF